MAGFQPRYVFEEELLAFGLPDTTIQPNIMSLVDGASSFIDEYCGRTDGDGNGSLVYTTYSERILLPEGRNIFRVMFKPMATVDTNTVAQLAASGANYYTGVQANTIVRSDGTTVTPIISASGRYGYGRRARQAVYPDLNMGVNVLQVAAFFGGPPTFTPIDPAATDFEPKYGECWVPAGLYMTQYTEVVMTYNSGYDPRNMPRSIKHACAALVRNLLARGGGTTGLKSLVAGRVSAQFTDTLVDPTVDTWLSAFKNVVAY